MLEKFSENEISQMLEELEAQGYDIQKNNGNKGAIARKQAEKLEINTRDLCSEVKHAIFEIADFATGNIEVKGYNGKFPTKTCKKRTVDNNLKSDYEMIIYELLKALKPYLDKCRYDYYWL